MKFKVLIWIILIASFSTTAKAGMFSGYDIFCGLPVFEGYDPQTATARTDQHGNQYIHIDPRAINNWTMSKLFILAHECAHHLLRHTSSLGKLERFHGGTAKQELEADCWAAQKLFSIGYDTEISKTILEQANKGHFSGSHYPSGYQRAQNILNCVGYNVNQCEVIVEECHHLIHQRGDRTRCNHIVPAHPMGDRYPCQHPCPGPYGAVPCHSQGDIVQCQHPVQEHPFDLVQCNHKAHPEGHSKNVCF